MRTEPDERGGCITSEGTGAEKPSDRSVTMNGSPNTRSADATASTAKRPSDGFDPEGSAFLEYRERVEQSGGKYDEALEAVRVKLDSGQLDVDRMIEFVQKAHDDAFGKLLTAYEVKRKGVSESIDPEASVFLEYGKRESSQDGTATKPWKP